MRPTYDDNCAGADTAETHRTAVNHGVSDHVVATEALSSVADTTPLASRGFTTSTFDMAPSGVTTARDGTWISWMPSRGGRDFVAADDTLSVAAVAPTARAAVRGVAEEHRAALIRALDDDGFPDAMGAGIAHRALDAIRVGGESAGEGESSSESERHGSLNVTTNEGKGQ